VKSLEKTAPDGEALGHVIDHASLKRSVTLGGPFSSVEDGLLELLDHAETELCTYTRRDRAVYVQLGTSY
jgi:hypothetical protein